MDNQDKTFNLLSKVNVQKTFVDKLYDFLVGPARLIIVGVMVVIIGVFSFRFVLDSQLRDLRKETEIYQRQVKNIVEPNEAEYRQVLKSTLLYANYLEMYRKSDGTGGTQTINSTAIGQEGKVYFHSAILKEIYDIRDTKYATTIFITDINFDNEPDNSSIRVNGTSQRFISVDEYVTDIKKLGYVKDADATNIGSSKDETPKFQIDILLKP